ncbi:hypothetical protein GALL_361660 [mine drainage metagenome]|uniref:Uncharacterized protein n=1 Tax=mine drainage metagenome TaxID=410659 RepID=A0A1J5QF17_9ZZZZ
MQIDDLFDDKKTIYTIIDENDERSSITIDKWVADLLQEMLPDVHEWIKEKYDIICIKKPQLSRREKGNLIRELARREAVKSKNYKSLIDFL